MKPTDTPTFTGKLYIRADHLVIKGEPVAWELRKGKTDRVLVFLTNDRERAHNWKCSLEEVVPLYTAPQPQFTHEQLKSVLEALQIGEDFAYGKYVRTGKPTRDIARSKIRAAIAALEKYRGMK